MLHGRARAVAATLASVAAKARARNSRLDLTDAGKAVTYLTNNHQHMRYDKALAAGWPIATGMIEGACRFEDRFGITGARWSPDGADVILKLRALVVNGDLDDYMTYYKQRYLEDIHLTRYDPASIPSDSPHDLDTRKCHTSQRDAPISISGNQSLIGRMYGADTEVLCERKIHGLTVQF